MTRETLCKALEASSAFLIVWPASLLILAVSTAVFGWPVSGWLLAPSLTAAIGCAAYAADDAPSRTWCAAIVAPTTVVAYAIASATYDGSYDGLWYHQEAILRLVDGWIPLWESARRLGDTDQLPWLDHYPKAAWLAAAAVVDATGRIEAGKLFGITLMGGAAAQTGACLLRVTSWPTARVLLLSGLAAANPVAIYQSTSYYIDGWLASCLTVMAAAAVGYTRTSRAVLLVVAVAASLVLINLKFTGLVYWAFFIAALVLGAYAYGARRQSIRLASAMVVTGALGIVLLGYNPYIANLRQHGHMFYPVVKSDGIEPTMMANNLPANLRSLNRVTRFIVANAAVSDGEYPPPSAELKWPFELRRSELAAWRKYDVRIGGFGPLFSGMLLLTALLMVASARWRLAETGVWIGAAAVVLLSVFLHSEGWWARYAPHAWTVPLLVAAAAAGSQHRLLRTGGRIVIGVALVNVIIVAGAYAHAQRSYATAVRDSLAAMHASQPVRLWPGRFASMQRRLREAGVAFTLDLSSTGPPSTSHTIPSAAPEEARWQ